MRVLFVFVYSIGGRYTGLRGCFWVDLKLGGIGLGSSSSFREEKLPMSRGVVDEGI